MIQMNTRLEVADNTGAKSAMMIRRLGQKKSFASVGDIIVVNIRNSSTDATVKKGCDLIRMHALFWGRTGAIPGAPAFLVRLPANCAQNS